VNSADQQLVSRFEKRTRRLLRVAFATGIVLGILAGLGIGLAIGFLL